MTRKEILKMETGPMLNAMVAHRVMKWGISHSESRINSNRIYILSLDKSAPYFIEPGKIYDYSRCCIFDIPFYSMYIGDAWEVVEKLQLSLIPQHYPGQPTEYWAAVIGNPTKIGENYIFGKTAPEAIVKAALLAVMKEVPDDRKRTDTATQ